MSNGHRTIVALLTVVALLLALNLIATTSPAANDETSANGPPVPTIVKLLPVHQLVYHRFWSDGRHDQLQRTEGNCDYAIEKAPSHGPVEHTADLVDAVQGSNHGVQAFMLTYADGRVDLIGGAERCTIAGVGTPSLCIGDVDRSGTVGIEDFLIVLAEWGCQ